jgi:hypothetical protein
LPSAPSAPGRSVFISYSRRDAPRVDELAARLTGAGVPYWLDRDRIDGAQTYGPEIAEAIAGSAIVLLACSDAALRSREVKQEIQLAWKYERPILPVLLEPTSFPRQVEYWLTGWQWIDTYSNPPDQWWPLLLRALTRAGFAAGADEGGPAPAVAMPQPIAAAAAPPLPADLRGLRSLASLTDQIWPVPRDAVAPGGAAPATRGLGAPQPDVQHGYRIGSRMCLALESERAGHLLLLDEGPENLVYCLCPSWFAPDTRLAAGRTTLPQLGSRYDAFLLTGVPGREHLLAVITDEPLGLDWMPSDPATPARVLSPTDIRQLLQLLHALDGSRWSALSTYFDIVG